MVLKKSPALVACLCFSVARGTICLFRQKLATLAKAAAVADMSQIASVCSSKKQYALVLAFGSFVLPLVPRWIS
ncbi:hypothetical protein OK016_00490 [Vibrio chagasii]|nr:hypothetical protein [Vibrio chagasii]